jgi:uncharacterized protein YcbK (DUF882 family)
LRINDIRLSPHFRLMEFECRCCGAVKLLPDLIELLEAIRSGFGRPMVITSGYRCAGHNRAVRGSKRSLHLLGRAADVRADMEEQMEIESLAKNMGFSEIICGNKSHYIHLAL